MTAETSAPRTRASLASASPPRKRTARAVLRRFLHPSRARSAARSGAVPDRAGSDAADPILGELRSELSYERKEVLVPLLRRLQTFADRIEQQQELPMPLLQEGLDLWQEYVEKLHDAHIRDLEAVGAKGALSDAGKARLSELEQDPPRAHARIGEIRSMMADFTGGYRYFGELLSLTIRGNTLSELAWEGFEEEFLRSWNLSVLAATSHQLLKRSLPAARKEAEELQQKVQRFLLRTGRYASLDPPTPAPPRDRVVPPAAA